MDIIVTTPKSEMANAAKEAADMIAAGGGYYFRRLSTMPTQLNIDDRVWYVEDGFIRGYARVTDIVGIATPRVCQTTGKVWEPGVYVEMNANGWRWIKPIPHKGFQGWRYFDVESAQFQGKIAVVGNWLSDKPEVAHVC